MYINAVLLRALYKCILHTTKSSEYRYTPYYWELCISVYSILLRALYICILHTTESSVYLYTSYYWELCISLYSILRRALYIYILHATENSVYSILLKVLYIYILHTSESSVYLYTPYYWKLCIFIYFMFRMEEIDEELEQTRFIGDVISTQFPVSRYTI